MTGLWRIMCGYRGRFIAVVVAASLATGTGALLHPLLLKALFDHAVLAADIHAFLVLSGCYLLLGLTLNLGNYLVMVWRRRLENALTSSLEMELLDRTLGLDLRRVSEAGNAAFVSRIHNDVAEGVLPAIDVCVKFVRTAVGSVVFVGVLLYLSWQASLVLVVIVPPLVYASNRLAKRIQDNTDPERDAEAAYVNTLTRTLAAFRALRGLPSVLPGTRAANRRALDGFLDITFVNYRLVQRQTTLSGLVMNLSDTASMVVGASFVFAGRMTFGSFLAFVNALWRAVTGIVDVINLIPLARRSTAVLDRIEALLGSRATHPDKGAAVLVRDVRVGYDGGGDGVPVSDFTMRTGERVLLRGPNGCGKTTLLNVIGGTLAPDAGTVTVPSRVAALTAPVHLPPLPVRDLVGDARLRASLELTGLVDRLPAELSSGQRQRVGVAALLAEDADLYLADEPFANLDDRGRDLVLRALIARTRNRGLLVVHHGDDGIDGHFDRVVTLSAAAAPVGR